MSSEAYADSEGLDQEVHYVCNKINKNLNGCLKEKNALLENIASLADLNRYCSRLSQKVHFLMTRQICRKYCIL